MANPLACPKCEYERKATDRAPITQCPSCEIVFAKYKRTPETKTTSTPVKSTLEYPKTEPPPRRTTKTNWFIGAGAVLVVIVVLLGQNEANTRASDPTKNLLSIHGAQIVAAAEPGVLSLRIVEKTTEAPVRAYRVVFATQNASLMSDKAGSFNRGAFLRNQGVALVWKAKFCTGELVNAMRQNGIGMVSGQIQDGNGEIQAIAICNS